jgi:HPr kinase/phosphorylase
VPDASTIHASAVVVGPKALLIRGSSGSGKSRLAWNLIGAAGQGLLPFVRLVGDDRVYLERCRDRLLVRPAQALAGKIEIRGLGIRTIAFEPVAVVGLVVDLGAPDGVRHPVVGGGAAEFEGLTIPRLAVAAGTEPLPLLLAALRIPPGDN